MREQTKQSVETFMGEYFRAKCNLEKKQLEIRDPYRKQFYSDDCVYDSHQDTLARFQSEKIVDIQEDATLIRVITRQIGDTSKGSVEMILRYDLQPFNAKWRIHNVAMACLVCHGKDKNCPVCRGDYWSWSDTRQK